MRLDSERSLNGLLVFQPRTGWTLKKRHNRLVCHTINSIIRIIC